MCFDSVSSRIFGVRKTVWANKGEKKTNEEEGENLRGGYWKEKGIIKKVNEIKYSKTHKYAEKNGHQA